MSKLPTPKPTTCCAARVKAWYDGARDALNGARRSIVELTRQLTDLDDPK